MDDDDEGDDGDGDGGNGYGDDGDGDGEDIQTSCASWWSFASRMVEPSLSISVDAASKVPALTD